MNPELEKKRRRRRLKLACLCLGRRLLALLLCFVLCLTLLPLRFSVFASETTGTAAATESPGSTENTESTGSTEAPTPSGTTAPTDIPQITPPSVIAERTVSAADETPVSGGTNVSNTYLFEVSTGSVRDNGTVDNVKYFVIYYTTGSGENAKTRSTVIFPGKDGIRTSMDAASQVANRNGRRETVKNVFGYTTPALRDRKGLGALHTDQYLFTTPEPVTTIDRIQIFGELEKQTAENGHFVNAASTWACQGMRIARVDKLYGLEMYGWYSDDGYIDYKGEIIADVVMNAGGGIFHWNSSAGVFNIVGPGVSSGVGVTLVNTETAASFGKPNFVGTQHDSQVTSRVVFRMDLADSLNAGFECLAGSYSAGANSPISSLKLCEAASMRIRYEDIYGCIREVNLPLIINALGWTMEKLGGSNNGDVAIAGYAQQGESIPLSAMLPDFKRIAWTTSTGSDSQAFEISIGEARAREKTHIQSVDSADQTIRPGRITKADNEQVAYLCTAFYTNTAVKLEHDSAMIHCSFLPGSQEPSLYYTSSSVEGVKLSAGTDNKISMSKYKEGMKLLPVDRRELYLITMSTDNIQIAGTMDDIYLQFTYKNMREKEVTTDEYLVRDYVKQFYGEWPGNVDNFAYKYGLRGGGTIQFMIPIANVMQFQSVSVKVTGGDEWQFKGISVQYVNNYSARFARWEELSTTLSNGQEAKSHLRISRTVSAKPACFQVGTVHEDGKPPVDPDDPAWQAGNLVQDDGMYHEFNGHSEEVSAYEPFDWSEYRYFMTYEDTLQDLGFDRTRCNFEVTVKVAGDKVNAEDDDCGSGNLFYFQLLFENGKSGCVLANQQLQSDAFRTGAEATFQIPTTQDYGDLTAIRIIPDDQDSNTDIYDKLKIEYITVRKQTTGLISPTWTADSDSQDGLGWVGVVDYRDPGSAGSNRGTDGRSVSEFSHTFEITKTSYSTKLLISITTGAYASELRPNADGEMVQINDPVLEGGMTMSYHYIDYDGRSRSVDPFDIVAKMNEYSGLEDTKYRIIDGVKEDVTYCVSNRDYQFRPGKTDNFYIDVDNIYQIIDMQLQIRSNVVTKWNITNVSVYLVQGVGTRYINGNGEYDYKYPAGQELSFRCSWNQPATLTKDVQIYRTPTGDPNSIAGDTSIATVNISFNENEFPISDDTWSSTVVREPKTKDDSLNLFLFPSTDSSASDPDSYGLSCEVLYMNTMTHSDARAKCAQMTQGEDASGRPVFYALGLNTSYFESFTGVEVKSTSVRPVHVPISYGIMQRIRSGVLIESYYLMGAGNADNSITLYAVQDPGGQNIQRAMLQVSMNTPVQKLEPDEKDLAVAIYFYTDDAYGRELRSKYVYLTDMGYDEIYPGQVLEVDFGIMNLREVTGINLVTMGRLDISLDSAEILEQSANGTVTGKWSFRERITPARTPTRINTNGIVSLLDLSFKTALSEGTVNSGVNGPIKMTVGYLDESGSEYFEEFEDITLYITESSCFQAGDTDRIRLLIVDMAELRWVKLEPLSEAGALVDASWKLESLSAMVDLSGLSVSRTVNHLIVEHEPLTISLADILLAGTISIIRGANEQGTASGDYTIPTGGFTELVLNIGEGVRILPRLQGSKQGVEVTINRYDPTNGALGYADLVDTRGYTYEVLEANAQAAEDKGYTEEAAVWRSIILDTGTYEVIYSNDPITGAMDVDAVVFLPPHNYTSSAMSYRITFTSKENSAATVYVNLTVQPETNPVDDLIAQARGTDQQTANHVHSIVHTAAVEPTCMHEGNFAYYSCAGCGKYFRDALGKEEIPDINGTVRPALGHNWIPGSKIITEATCTEAETREYTCTRCSETKTDVYGDPLGHEWGEWTSNENGQHSRTCSRCSAKETQDCSYTETVTPPTTTEQGYTTHTCTVCGYSYKDNFTDPIPAEPEPPEPTDAAPTEPSPWNRRKEGENDV